MSRTCPAMQEKKKKDNCYGTDNVPLSTQYFIAAFTFHPFGVQQTWPTPGSPVTVSHSSRPELLKPSAPLPLMQTTFSRPLPNQPADDDTEMTGPTIEGEIIYSSEVETRFGTSPLRHRPSSLHYR